MQIQQPEQTPTKNGICTPVLNPPDPEVKATGRRRKFTARQKLKYLEQTDSLSKGDIGAFLRQHGLYWSCLTKWRKQREQGLLAVLEPKKRGCPARPPEARRAVELERENTHLRIKLGQAEKIIDVQKKLCELFEVSPVN
jgi:transposase-like protein